MTNIQNFIKGFKERTLKSGNYETIKLIPFFLCTYEKLVLSLPAEVSKELSIENIALSDFQGCFTKVCVNFKKNFCKNSSVDLFDFFEKIDGLYPIEKKYLDHFVFRFKDFLIQNKQEGILSLLYNSFLEEYLGRKNNRTEVNTEVYELIYKLYNTSKCQLTSSLYLTNDNWGESIIQVNIQNKFNKIILNNTRPYFKFISQFNILFHDFSNVNYENNIITYDNVEKDILKLNEAYDLIISSPVFFEVNRLRQNIKNNLLLSSKHNDVININYVLNRLNEKGSAFMILPTKFFKAEADSQKQMISHLIEQNILEAVVQLPKNWVIDKSNYSGALLVLSKKSPKTKQCFFIDASQMASKEYSFKSLYSEDLDSSSLWKDRNDVNNISKKVNYSVIIKNNFNLEPSNYINYDNSKNYGYKEVKMNKIIDEKILQLHWLSIEKRLIKYKHDDQLINLAFFLIYFKYITKCLESKDSIFKTIDLSTFNTYEHNFIEYVESFYPIIKYEYPNYLAYTSLLKNISTFSLQDNVRVFIDIIEKIEVENLSQFFNYVVDAKAKAMGGFYTLPSGVNKLLSQLLLSEIDYSEPISIYNPTVGFGNSLIELGFQHNKNVSLYGQEIERNIALLCEMNLIVAGISAPYILNKDVFETIHLFEEFNKNEFDYIISSPPLADIEHRSRTFPMDKYIHYVLDHLTEKGKAVMLLPTRLLSSVNRSNREISRFLVENKYIKGIINLPKNVTYRYNEAVSVVILSKEEHLDKVFIVDTIQHNKKQYFSDLSIEVVDGLLNTWRNKLELELQSKWISINEIVSENYSLDLGRYFKIEIEVPNGYVKYKLSDLLSRLNLVSYTSIEYLQKLPLVTINQLAGNPFSKSVELDYESDININRRYQVLSEKALIISKVGGKFKFAYYENPSETILLHDVLAAFQVNESLVSSKYLMLKFTEKAFLEQYQRILTGSVARLIHIRDFFNLEVAIPDLQTQERIYLGAKLENDKSKIKELQLQNTIDSILKEQTIMSQWKLHDLRNGPLLKLIGATNELKMFSENNLDFFQIHVMEGFKRTLQNVVDDIFISAIKVSQDLTNLYEFKHSSNKQETINIISFLANFFNSKEEEMGNKVFFDLRSLEIFQKKEEIEKTNEKMNFEILFNKDELLMILENILENAVRHGRFISEDDGNKFRVNSSLIDQDTISIEFLNTGEPSTIKSSDFFLDGFALGPTGNSGKGGFIVKTLIEKNGGQVIQKNIEPLENDGYVFGVELLLNRKTDYEV